MEAITQPKARDKSDNEQLGLVVRVNEFHSLIWSPNCKELIRAHRDQKGTVAWPLSTWVQFRCNATDNSAQSIRKAEDKPRESRLVVKTQNEIAMLAESCRYLDLGNEFIFLMQDDFLGRIICPMDRELRRSIRDQRKVKLVAFFTDEFRSSRWIAFAMQTDECGEWIKLKLNGLPKQLEAEADALFHNGSNPFSSFMPSINRSKFGSPPNWNGPIKKADGGQIEDVLGVVVKRERNDRTSLVVTRFGVARHPTRLELGTWLRATIAPIDASDDDDCTLHWVGQRCAGYSVLHSVKIKPPISTRMVRHNGNDRLLFCANVQPTGDRGTFECQFLGAVLDPKHQCPPREIKNNKEGIDANNGLLVEFGLAVGKAEARRSFWKALKCHGAALPSVHNVPLEMSVFPNEMGSTCDGAHFVLSKREFCAAQQQQPAKTGVATPNSNSRARDEQPVPIPPTAVQIAPTKQKTASSIGSATSTTSSCVSSAAVKRRVDSLQCALQTQLGLYRPDLRQVQHVGVFDVLGLVVRKCADYALLYTRVHGLVLLVRRQAGISQRDFDAQFVLGSWWSTALAPVHQCPGVQLRYNVMSVQHEEPVWPNDLPKVRVLDNKFLQVLVDCHFSGENIHLCRDQAENCYFYYLATEGIGRVYVTKQQMADYQEQRVKLWLAHVAPQHGCRWMIAQEQGQNSKNSNKFSIP